MKTTIETITPQFAADVLESKNPHNRTVSEGTVQSYAQDMRNKRWTLTHQGIAFDVNGNLLDGQHRLWAVVFSECEVEMMVTRGLPVDSVMNGIQLHTMDSIDRNRVRTTGQQMQLSHSIKNGACVAGACRAIATLISPADGQKRLSTSTSLLIHSIYGDAIAAVLDTMTGTKRKAAVIGPLAMLHKAYPEAAIAIRNQMVSLENISQPIRLFLKFMESGIDRLNSEKTARLLCNAIEACHNGRQIKQLKDGAEGRSFVTNLNPSPNRRIRDAIKPVVGVSLNLRSIKNAKENR